MHNVFTLQCHTESLHWPKNLPHFTCLSFSPSLRTPGNLWSFYRFHSFAFFSECNISSVQLFSRVRLWSRGLQHARLPCPRPSPGACSNSCPSSRWCHPTILSSVVPFSSCLPSFPVSLSSESVLWITWPKYWSVSFSITVLPMNIQDWVPLGLTGRISLQFKGLSRVFSNTPVQKHQFLSAQLSL